MDEPRSLPVLCFSKLCSSFLTCSEAGGPQLCPNQPLPRADAGLPHCPQLTIQAPSFWTTAMFLSSACGDTCLQASDGCPNFSCLWKLGRSSRGLLTLGLQLHCRSGCTGLPGARPLCLERPSTGSGTSAQLSLTEPPAQLAWAARCDAEPQAEPRQACSHTPAIAEICSTRHRTQSSTWILPLPYFLTLLFLLHRCFINHY